MLPYFSLLLQVCESNNTNFPLTFLDKSKIKVVLGRILKKIREKQNEHENEFEMNPKFQEGKNGRGPSDQIDR